MTTDDIISRSTLTDAREGQEQSTLPDLTIVGAGRAGASLALALALQIRGTRVHLVCRSSARRARLTPWFAGLPVELVSAPTPAMLRCRLVVFATADRDIGSAASIWHAACGPAAFHQTRLHLSGAAVPDVLRLAGHDGPIGSCHPLAAIPDPLTLTPPDATVSPADLARAARPLRGAFFALAGDPEAMTTGRRLAQAVGGDPHEVPVTHHAAYHGAASVVANDLVTLLAIGERLCAQASLPQAASRPALLHLARTALDAVGAASVQPGASLADGLTGAVGRGDAMTLTRHLVALEASPDDAEAHRRLSRVLLALVVSGGQLSADRAAAIKETLA